MLGLKYENQGIPSTEPIPLSLLCFGDLPSFSQASSLVLYLCRNIEAKSNVMHVDLDRALTDSQERHYELKHWVEEAWKPENQHDFVSRRVGNRTVGKSCANKQCQG